MSLIDALTATPLTYGTAYVLALRWVMRTPHLDVVQMWLNGERDQ